MVSLKNIYENDIYPFTPCKNKSKETEDLLMKKDNKEISLDMIDSPNNILIEIKIHIMTWMVLILLE